MHCAGNHHLFPGLLVEHSENLLTTAFNSQRLLSRMGLARTASIKAKTGLATRYDRLPLP